jgi:hypothetical protein
MVVVRRQWVRGRRDPGDGSVASASPGCRDRNVRDSQGSRVGVEADRVGAPSLAFHAEKAALCIAGADHCGGSCVEDPAEPRA